MIQRKNLSKKIISLIIGPVVGAIIFFISLISLQAGTSEQAGNYLLLLMVTSLAYTLFWTPANIIRIFSLVNQERATNNVLVDDKRHTLPIRYTTALWADLLLGFLPYYKFISPLRSRLFHIGTLKWSNADKVLIVEESDPSGSSKALETDYKDIRYSELSFNRIVLKADNAKFYIMIDSDATNAIHAAGQFTRVGAGPAIAAEMGIMHAENVSGLFAAIEASGGVTVMTNPVKAVVVGMKLGALLIIGALILLALYTN